MTKGKSLIVLAQEYRQFADQIAAAMETAEESSEVIEMMENNALAVEQKASATALYIKRCGMLADQIGEQIKALTERKRALENKQNSAKDYLLTCMQAAGITKIENADLMIRVQKGRGKVDIFDEGMIPMEYMKQPAPVPNKSAILADLKEGVIIDGCRLETSESVVIR